jgi:hypothetical protein
VICCDDQSFEVTWLQLQKKRDYPHKNPCKVKFILETIFGKFGAEKENKKF